MRVIPDPGKGIGVIALTAFHRASSAPGRYVRDRNWKPSRGLRFRVVMRIAAGTRSELGENQSYGGSSLVKRPAHQRPQPDKGQPEQTDPQGPARSPGAGGNEVDQHRLADFCLEHLRE